jgi:hypothetical protein
MDEPILNQGAASILVLILPFAVTVVFLYAAWPWLLGLLALAIALSFWQRYQWKLLGDRINPAFNALLKTNQGCMTAVDLALHADLKVDVAQQFLEQQAAKLGAQRKTVDAQGTVYYFLTASSLGNILAESEPDFENETEALSDEELNVVPEFKGLAKPRSQALIQAELAKRLNVHSGTITKRKKDPSFPEWSCKRDPEGIAWRYAPKQKLFVPLDLSGK